MLTEPASQPIRIASSLVLTCRGCGGESCIRFLSLSHVPLANGLLPADAPVETEPLYPLEVAFCQDCSLVQLTHTIPPETLFDEYVYLSSVADTVVEQARLLAEKVIRERNLGPASLVLEIASNDGYLLRHFAALGIPVLGIEPAVNVARIATRNGVRTLNRYFCPEVASELRMSGVAADIVVANNVMAHIPDINDAIEGIHRILKPEGVLIIETPYVVDLIHNLEFDTIYHEHVFYYSLTALITLFARHGLTVVDVERLEIHGGSLRLTVSHEGSQAPKATVGELLAEEVSLGVDRLAFYQGFGESVRGLRRGLVSLLRALKSGRYNLAAYGASAKGTTLLNVSGIGCDLLDFVADRSTLKRGMLTPGTRLPIVPAEWLLEKMPDYVLLLSWNFRDEILAQQDGYRRLGGKFILPLPEVAVL